MQCASMKIYVPALCRFIALHCEELRKTFFLFAPPLGGQQKKTCINTFYIIQVE